MKNSERLEAAAELLEKKEWVRFHLYSHKPSHKPDEDEITGHCLVGSVLATKLSWTEYLNARDADFHEEKLVAAQLIQPALESRKYSPSVPRPSVPSRWNPYNMVTDWSPYNMVTDQNDNFIKDKEEAIGVLMDAAKYWRNLGE